jgi:hypothetical protein
LGRFDPATAKVFSGPKCASIGFAHEYARSAATADPPDRSADALELVLPSTHTDTQRSTAANIDRRVANPANVHGHSTSGGDWSGSPGR